MEIRDNFVKLALLNGIFIIIWFAFWLVFGDSHWFLTALNRWISYLFIPTILIILLAIAQRRVEIIGITVIPIIIFFYLYGAHFLPTKKGANTSVDFRVMTFNVLYSNRNYEKITNLMQNQQPDLVALQEVQPEMLAELTENLNLIYPSSFIAPANDYGTTSILSRHPIISSTAIPLGVDRPASMVEIVLDDKVVQFISIHLQAYGIHNFPLSEIPEAVELRTVQQNTQVKLLLEKLELLTGEIQIIGCDCNSKETSSSYRLLSQEFSDASRQVGFWLGSPLSPGETRNLSLDDIEFIFYRGALNPITTRIIINKAGSDHRPLIAEFEFAE